MILAKLGEVLSILYTIYQKTAGEEPLNTIPDYKK